jgi:hypothetical protein
MCAWHATTHPVPKGKCPHQEAPAESAGKKGIFWALAKRKRGYSKIDEALQLLLVVEFNNHPHVIVSKNRKDMLQLKNADGKKVLVPKVLTQVGLGTIFSNIVKDNPTIKNKLGRVCCLTNSYKQMCGCRECDGLHVLHCSLLAKHSVMFRVCN